MENVVPMLLGIFFIVFSLRLITRFRSIAANGLETDGVIESPEASGHAGKTVFVSFKTQDEELVTGPNSNAILASFVKPGDRVTVYYYAADPSVFIIRTKYTNLLLAAFAVAGTGLIVIGLSGIIAS